MAFLRTKTRLLAPALAVSAGIVACTAVPQFITDAQDGGGGANAATGASSSSGEASVCSTPSDCKGAENDCSHRTCVAERCAESLTSKDTPIGIQTEGDCQKTVCDGKGTAVLQPDVTDVPNDHDPCTADSCGASGPVHKGIVGESCGAGTVMLECNVKSQCEGCSDATDCGVSTACVTVSCLAPSQLCFFTPAPDGQILKTGQTAGDCLTVVCNGEGQTKTIPDDSDHPPDDGDPCTQETCESGAPAHPPIPGLNDGNVCTHDTCGASMVISHKSFPDGTPCGGCSTCVSGVCKPGPCAP